jgi:hypothetical protein
VQQLKSALEAVNKHLKEVQAAEITPAFQQASDEIRLAEFAAVPRVVQYPGCVAKALLLASGDSDSRRRRLGSANATSLD